MSSNNNDLLIIVVAVGAYMMMKRNRAAPMYQQQQGGYPAVPSMPGNVGTGSNQVGVNALSGFISAIAGTFGNNTSSSQLYQQPPPSNYGAVQDSVSGDLGYMNDWAMESGW